jgi:hypothetical protein
LGERGLRVPKLVSVSVAEVVVWDFISDVMKPAAVDNAVRSLPSYRYLNNLCEFTVNRLMFSEELVS